MAMAGVLAAVVVATFLFAPVVYVFSLHSAIYPGNFSAPVYVSLGCKTVGFGTIYSPPYGVALACSVGNAGWILPV